jgi:hypothetical protein
MGEATLAGRPIGGSGRLFAGEGASLGYLETLLMLQEEQFVAAVGAAERGEDVAAPIDSVLLPMAETIERSLSAAAAQGGLQNLKLQTLRHRARALVETLTGLRGLQQTEEGLPEEPMGLRQRRV